MSSRTASGAIALDAANPYHHLTAARVLARARRFDEALRQAETANSLATDDRIRRQIEELTASIQRAKG